MKQWFTLIGYRTLTWSMSLLLRAHLQRRLWQGKEKSHRLGERMGNPSTHRPRGKLIWIHAVSIGESLSMLPLLRAIMEKSDTHVLVTTGTVTSADILADRLPHGVIHQFIPLDHPIWVRRFLNYWRPDFAIFVEGELWPNLLNAVRARRVPTILVNATMSKKTFGRWRFARSLLKRMLNTFEMILAATREDEVRFQRLGITHCEAIGHLKFSVPPLETDSARLQIFQSAIAGRTVWLAASTHKGEEEKVSAVHQQIAPHKPGLLTILALRHPKRIEEVKNILAQHNLSFRLHSEGTAPTTDDDVYIVDTMGDMGLFFRLAPVTFLGGSLVPIGGHNIVEPMQLDSALVVGPHMESLYELTSRFLNLGALQQVQNVDSLVETVERLLSDADMRQKQVQCARQAIAAEARALVKIMEAIKPLLQRAGIWNDHADA